MGYSLILVVCILASFTIQNVGSQTASTVCGTLTCGSDQFCFPGTTVLCINCNVACNGCTGPGPAECKACKIGFSLVGSTCTQCPVGSFGSNCNGTCHCILPTDCDSVSGHCTGKCEKGYYKPPQCQEECPDLYWGLDCLNECHCLNNSICDKKLGFCPNNTCHPDWTSFGCSKRLPKLAKPPTVLLSSCAYVAVEWPTWNSNEDFGDVSLPVYEYRLYWRQNGTGSAGWRRDITLQQNPSITKYHRNVTGLPGDRYYEFRVDVHYSDDNKVVENASPGFVSQPPTFVMCTTTTTPPPITIPIIVGPDIFDNVSASSSSQSNGTLVITWSIAPDLRRFQWNITLAYRVIGTGNCPLGTPSPITYVLVNQTVTTYRVTSVLPWSRYEVVMTAQGQGSISTANGTKTITPITYEILPSGNVSDIRAEENQSTSVMLRWTELPCLQRGGMLLHYDIALRQPESGWSRNSTSNTTSHRLDQLTPYTNYTAQVRFVNSAGAGTFGPLLLFTTAEGVPSFVSIINLVATETTVTVNLTSPVQANGVIIEYDVTYSTVATFALAQSTTMTFESPLTSLPVVDSLRSNTDFFFKARARTSAGYGLYGNVATTKTLPATALPPSSVLQSFRNMTCVTLTWTPPQSSPMPVTAYRLTIVKQSGGGNNQGDTLTLPANTTTFTKCDLEPSSRYTVTVTSLSNAITGEATTVTVTTELADAPTPYAPTLYNVSTTTATVILNPVSSPYVTAYLLKVEAITSGRKKRLAAVPGYETAQLAPANVTGGMQFTIGDGKQYGGYTNKPLESGRQYRLHYLVQTAANNETKYGIATMADPIVTVVPTTPTVPTSPTTTTTTAQPLPVEESNNGVLIGVIVGLILLIILIIVIVILCIWWRRRRNLKIPPPYVELDDGMKKKPAPKVEPYEPEKYWNQISSLRESRYIVVGRECLPDTQLVPIDGHDTLQPGPNPIAFRQEFKSLPKHFNQATTLEAEQHPDRNRFPHILAYDHSRVELAGDASSRSSYINANWLSGYKRPRCYVAAQSPYNDETAIDFWRLIHQYNVKTVVMIANIVEDSIVKCTQFWPREGKVSIGHFYLELQSEQVYADFVVRDVMVRESRDVHGRTVRLYEYTSWPDHGVPDDPIPFLDMRYKVRQYHGDDRSPILVHCGTGVARTGCFVAVDSLIEQYGIEGRISVYSFVRKMRKERPLMVRTCKQYVFIYESLLEVFQAGHTMVDATTIKPMYHDWTARNPKTGRSFLRDQFQLLQRLTRGPTPEQCLAATTPDNVKRNRYPDLVPSDQYRPRLLTHASLSKTDYINAVFVDGYRKQQQFILTQTPLHTTLCDFWRLIYDHGVTTIVMMDNYQHADNTCAEYWPTDVILKQWEPFFIETTAAFQQENVTIRNLKMVNTQLPGARPHMVRQFQFNAWAEHSFTPVSKTMALDLMDLVLDYHQSSDHPDAPILVHCEDGATHSGLFVAMALLCERIDEEQEVDVYHVIKHVKRRRTQMINDYDQFRFCYKTLWDYVNLRMPGGTFTDTLGQNRTDKVYGAASLSLTSYQDDLY